MDDVTLLIAVPAYGGSIKSPCVMSLLKLQKALSKRSIKSAFDMTSYAEITAVRNLLGTLMLDTKQVTHLLFVDSDMQFKPESVLKLIEAEKPVIGCLYSERQESRGLVGVVDTPTEVPENGLIEVGALGMGLCLIERSVFEEMAADESVARQHPHPFPHRLEGPLIGFFNAPEEEAYLSEDIAFCRRYTSITGRPVHALAREDIGHVGEAIYRRATDISLIMPKGAQD
ncbi:MAG: hypothetical protein AAF291_14635 [Pseudomonadota bacterium]